MPTAVNIRARLDAVEAEAREIMSRSAAEGGPTEAEAARMEELADEASSLREELDVAEAATRADEDGERLSEFMARVTSAARQEGVPELVQSGKSRFHEMYERAGRAGSTITDKWDTTGVWRAIALANAEANPREVVKDYKRGLGLHPEPGGGLVTAALSVGTDSAGGHLVDDTTIAAVILQYWARSGMMGVARVIPTPRGELLDYPTSTPPTAGSAVTAEGAAYAGADPTVGQVTFNAYKATALIAASRELLQDAPMTANTVIQDALAAEMVRKTEGWFVTGDGSGKPTGILHAANPSAGSAGMGTVASFAAGSGIPGATLEGAKGALYDALYVHLTEAASENMLQWILGRAWYGGLARLTEHEDAPKLAGREDFAQMCAEAILGYQVRLLDFGPGLPAANTDDAVVFGAVGDFQQAFGIRIVTSDMMVTVNPFRLANHGQVEFQVDQRVDSKVLNTSAYATVSGPTYTA